MGLLAVSPNPEPGAPPPPATPTEEHNILPQFSDATNHINQRPFPGISQPKAPLQLKQPLCRERRGPGLTLPLGSPAQHLCQIPHCTHLEKGSGPWAAWSPGTLTTMFSPGPEGWAPGQLSCSSEPAMVSPCPGDRTEGQNSLLLPQGPAHLRRHASPPDVLADALGPAAASLESESFTEPRGGPGMGRQKLASVE